MTSKILENLINNVSLNTLDRFFRDRNRKFTPNQKKLAQYENEMFKDAYKLGQIPFDLFAHLVICVFNVNKELTERSGKKAQYEIAKKILRDDKKAEAGIFVFIGEKGNFRFSLVYAKFLGTKVDFSNFRRFTYFVSPELTNKTFIQHIGEADFSSIESIKEAFSVEKVTSKFFNEFRDIFDRTKKEFERANKHTVCTWLKSKYDDDEYKEQINKFTFTFLGRIIFLYFLLRKGWIEDKRDYIRKIVEDKNNTNLYQDFFKPLFFDVFAKEPNQRSPEIKEQYKDTPYLNGGLFEHSDLERQMAKEGKFILFEDKFIRDIILNYFEAYNFTVDENSPDDKEVSIDPEMLGKIFENTLAEEERNKKGTFYTPREVVHFMVKDSIRQFLHNETGIPLKTLQKLIYSDDEEISYLTSNQIRTIDAKLEGVKILDPAVGSAAFPVEMMQVLIDLRKRLNVRVGRNINEVSLKKQLIKNNLYGVDIDPGAIEIAKLRLWLALIVDYDKSLAEPLPNLDFQFRVGNSLQEKIDDIDIFNQSIAGQMDWINGDSAFEKMNTEMIQVKDCFYRTNDERKRHQLKERFDHLEHQMIQAVLEKYHKQFQEQINNQNIRGTAKIIKETTEKIERLEQRIEDGTYKLFKPDFHFSEVFDRKDERGNRVGGFDIVIGNPPYGVNIDRDIQDWHDLGSRDSYGVFISTSLKRFLKLKGVLEFIVSDTWLTIKTHRNLRDQVLEKNIHKVIQLHQDCFDATVNACVLSITNLCQNKTRLISADLSKISTRTEIEELRKILYNIDEHVGESTPQYGVYSYIQNLIMVSANRPIFAGDPHILKIRNSINNLLKNCIDEICGGIKSYNDKKYIRNKFGNMGYKKVDPSKIVTHELSKNEKLLGIQVDDYQNSKYYIRYEKGGDTHNENGLLNLYYKPVEFYFPWDKKTVREVDKKHGLRNRHRYFGKGIGVSTVGVFAPIFRYCEYDVFFNNYNMIFPKNEEDTYILLAIFCSKAFRYFLNVFENHTVAKNQIDLLQVPIPENYRQLRSLDLLCKEIIKKLKKDINYDYVNNEQTEIDLIVYDAYGFTDNDIDEVETWYTRHYPKLADIRDMSPITT